jgi:hypothetical protein
MLSSVELTEDQRAQLVELSLTGWDFMNNTTTWCFALSEHRTKDESYRCSRPAGHAGLHVACWSKDRFIMAWDETVTIRGSDENQNW